MWVVIYRKADHPDTVPDINYALSERTSTSSGKSLYDDTAYLRIGGQYLLSVRRIKILPIQTRHLTE